MAALLASRRCTFGAVRSTSLQTVRPRVAAPVRGRRLVISAAADKAAVEADVITIIKEQLGTEDAITAESKFVDLGADSLDTVEIMMALEEKFDIELDEEGAEKISTVGQAVDVIVAQVDAK